MQPLMTLALGAAGYWLYKSGRLQPQIDRVRPQVESFLSDMGLRTPGQASKGTPSGRNYDDVVGGSTDREAQSTKLREWPGDLATAPSNAGDHTRADIQTNRPSSESTAPKAADGSEDLRDWPDGNVATAPSQESNRPMGEQKAST